MIPFFENIGNNRWQESGRMEQGEPWVIGGSSTAMIPVAQF